MTTIKLLRQQTRHLRNELKIKDAAIVKKKTRLSLMKMEIIKIILLQEKCASR